MQFSDTPQDLGTTLRTTIGRIQGKTITLRALMEDMGEQGLLLICAVASLPFLIPDFRLAVGLAGAATLVELAAITWVQSRFMETPPLSAAAKVVLGGALVVAAGILIGSG